jgi:uncharacterized protein VirK/YbjX
VSLNVHGKYNLLNILIMKKSILNLGKALNKAEQKSINGGYPALPCECESRYKECFNGRCVSIK